MNYPSFRFSSRIAVAAVAFLAAFEASAHGTLQGTSTFIAGLVHPLTALEHLLPLIALGMLAGQRGLAAGEGLVVAFPVAFASGAMLGTLLVAVPELSAVNAGTALGAGGLVALALALPRTLLYVIVIAVGGVHGLSNGAAIGESLPSFIAGATLASTLVFVYAFGATHHVLKRETAWLPVAVRAIGSWIAAFGILTLALAFAPGSTAAVASMAVGV